MSECQYPAWSIHIVSDPGLRRPGYKYNKDGVGIPADLEPYIVWNHIDGPLLCQSDGQLHWLTWWERFRCWLNLNDAKSIDAIRALKDKS